MSSRESKTPQPEHNYDYSVEEEWEDIKETIGATQRHSSVPSTPRSAARRRKPGTKTIYIAQSTPTRKLQKPKAPKDDEPPLVDGKEVRRAMKSGVAFTFSYVFDVLYTVVRLMRKPLAILIFLWLLGMLFKQLNSTFRLVLGPLCFIPGISSTLFCYTPPPLPDEGRRPQWADYPKLMDVQTATFEQLLDESAGGSGLSLDIKKAEMATRDLVTLVRVSDLTSKDHLADLLGEFVEDAKRTGRGLQKLNAKIGGAVDSIMAVNDYALHSIEAAKVKDSSALSVLWPFASDKYTREAVLRTFHDAMGVLSAHVQRVILEAQVSLSDLDKLEQTLMTLHELVSREDASISGAKNDLLGELWTHLGGNRRELRTHDDHLALLRSVGTYRARALAHVAAALQTLQGVSEEMEEMRDRVAAPEILGERIPVEVHVKSINAGLERMKEGRMRAKKREEQIVRSILGDGVVHPRLG